MSDYLRTSYNILNKICRDKSFGTETLYRELEGKENAELVHRIVMGVLEKYYLLDYIEGQLVKKAAKPAVSLIIKQGIYCLLYLDSIPDYAVVDNSVGLAKGLGKEGVSGFVNVVLKRVAARNFSLPQDDGSEKYMSVTYSKPLWLVRRTIKDYGEETARAILSAKTTELTHIRPNTRLMTQNDLLKYLKDNNIEYIENGDLGMFVKISDPVKLLFSKGWITYQSSNSIMAARALEVGDGMRVLDICAAPGGKSVLLSELTPKGEIIAHDIHSHRLSLIQAYARRMGANNITTALSDATVYNGNYEDGFDRVLADVPCSALGITGKQPDILLNRKEEDISSLATVQAKILDNAFRYLKKGGVLVYSTCTYMAEENRDNARRFLDAHENARPLPDNAGEWERQYLPSEFSDGFYIARFTKL